MKLKLCIKCKERKLSNLKNFKPDKVSRDGLYPYCRKCKQGIDRVYSRKYREENPDWKKEDNKRNTNLRNKLVAEYNERYPERMNAAKIYRWALRNGKLKRKECEVCGLKKTDGHHTDYTKPLKIIWLCHKHHKQLHAGIIKIKVAKQVKVNK